MTSTGVARSGSATPRPMAGFVLPGDLGHLELPHLHPRPHARKTTRRTGRWWRWCMTRRRRRTRRYWRWRGRRSPCWSRRCADPGSRPGEPCWPSCVRRTGVIARLQVLERTVPDSGDRLRRDWQRRGIHDGSLQAANYEQLLAAVDGSTMAHECFVAVSRRRPRRLGRRSGRPAAATPAPPPCCVREVDKIADGLQAAGVRVEGWCPPRLLGEIIRTAYDPAARRLVHRRGGAASDRAAAETRAWRRGWTRPRVGRSGPRTRGPTTGPTVRCTAAGGCCSGPASTWMPGSCPRCCWVRCTAGPCR